MNIEERIAAYHDGELTPDERFDLESELSSNPELKAEYDLQNEIIEGIKSARKAELKTMMNNVPIGGITSTGTGKVIQYTSAAVITAIIGFGLYYFWPDKQIEQLNRPTTEEVDNTAENRVAGEQSQDIASTEIPDTDLNNVSESESISSSPSNKKSEINSELSKKVEQIPETTTEVNTESAKPSIIDGFDQEETSEPDIPENSLLDKSDNGGEAILSEVISDVRKYNFHYKFLNGRLILYGEFQVTYEILDFMQGDERNVYLYYKGKYYPLILNQSEISPLKDISDSSIIKGLENRRKSR